MSGKECRISSPPVRGSGLPWERKRWLRPWSPVSTIWGVLSLWTASCVRGFGSCSNISATWTAVGTGNCLLKNKNWKLQLIAVGVSYGVQIQFSPTSICLRPPPDNSVVDDLLYDRTQQTPPPPPAKKDIFFPSTSAQNKLISKFDVTILVLVTLLQMFSSNFFAAIHIHTLVLCCLLDEHK